MTVSSRVAPGIAGLKPYQPGKPLSELEREYHIQDAVKLASNENPLGPGLLVQDAMKSAISQQARYPDGNSFELKQALAQRHAVEMNQITLGNGSNDVLELVARVFLFPGTEAIFSEHAFAVYPIATQAVGADAVVTPAKDYGYDLDAILAAITDKTAVIFIANPNNPTGTWLNESSLKAFMDKVPERIMVVVDEAYFEYVQKEDYPDTTQWLSEYNNLIVTRTFSKAYGLAGLRIGYSVSHTDIADLLNRVRQPFNVNAMAQVAALTALQDNAHIQQSLQMNINGMQQLTRAFSDMGFGWIPSVGNFVCLDVNTDGTEVYERLLHEGIIVRPVANYALPRHLRITIGNHFENDRLIASLNRVL
ncbi:MAG: histidinol-phosphate transaminase [Gammaproteobacteria bacterium]|nr:histidinol-phosphate transaminase [Gammaproteobacteria bacterium]